MAEASQMTPVINFTTFADPPAARHPANTRARRRECESREPSHCRQMPGFEINGVFNPLVEEQRPRLEKNGFETLHCKEQAWVGK